MRGRAVEERGEQQEGQVQRREKTRGQQRTREKVRTREERDESGGEQRRTEDMRR